VLIRDGDGVNMEIRSGGRGFKGLRSRVGDYDQKVCLKWTWVVSSSTMRPGRKFGCNGEEGDRGEGEKSREVKTVLVGGDLEMRYARRQNPD
jgi:hypothetical protein